MQGGERGAISAHREQQITGRDLHGLRDPARLSGDRDLADAHPVLRRPVANRSERVIDAPSRMDDKPELVDLVLHGPSLPSEGRRAAVASCAAARAGRAAWPAELR